MSQPRLKVPLVIVIGLVLHTAVLGHLRIAGVAPDLMLLMAVVGGLVGGAERGAWLGFACGLVADLVVNTTPVGLSALVFTVVGFTVGTIQSGILRSSWWIPLVTACVASAAGETFYALTGAVVGQTQLVTNRIATIVALVAVLNAALSPLVVRVLRWALAGARGPRAYV